jgi:spermidine synthase
MALEIAASRLLAPHLGVSLYSWTGIIGVVLAGVMFGNWAGGRIADHSPKAETLGTCLFLAGLFTLLTLISVALLSHDWDAASSSGVTRKLAAAVNWVNDRGLMGKIVAWAAILFLAPMYLLGTISPQVTRLAVADWDHAGRVAGRVYAFSCVGAIAGTFAAGWGGIPLLGGVNGLILAVALVLTVLSGAVGGLWRRPGELFLGTIVVAAALVGLATRGSLISRYDLETNYYAIRTYDRREVNPETGEERVAVDDKGRITRKLALDALMHSYVKGWVTTDAAGNEVAFRADPSYTGYEHEQVQAEFCRLAADQAGGAANILVIGGGGYTLPRWIDATLPAARVEVVEIDPGVTEVAHRKLGLPRDTKIVTHHMDGRQFVQERAAARHYQLVVQDAVNDLSVPYHIMTKEYNDAVKRLLTPDGVYLLTVIDEFGDGRLWRSAVRTMRETFPHVALLATNEEVWAPDAQEVYVIYGSGRPFDRSALEAAATRRHADAVKTIAMSDDRLRAELDAVPAPVLTDAYAPVDNLISEVFRNRADAMREQRRR